MQSDKACKASDTETEVEVSSTSSDGEINNVSVNKNEYNTSGHNDRSVNTHTKSSTCPCQNAGQCFWSSENFKEHEMTKATTSPHDEKKGETYSLQSVSSSPKK